MTLQTGCNKLYHSPIDCNMMNLMVTIISSKFAQIQRFDCAVKHIRKYFSNQLHKLPETIVLMKPGIVIERIHQP